MIETERINELDRHFVLEDAMGILRNEETKTREFREAAEVVFGFLAREIKGRLFSPKKVAVETPVGKTTCEILDMDSRRIILMPIIRSGIAMLSAFQREMLNWDVGFVGQQRDETTAEPREYYFNVPQIFSEDIVLILDPMIATGGSAVATIQTLAKEKATVKQMHIAAVVAAPEGLNLLTSKLPELGITVAAIDERLNEQKFIVPGLGDFGDRYWGTKNCK